MDQKIYRFYITAQSKETINLALQLMPNISSDDIINFTNLNDTSCNVIEITQKFLTNIIIYINSFSDADYSFDEQEEDIVDENGEHYLFHHIIDDELKAIIASELDIALLDFAKKTQRYHVGDLLLLKSDEGFYQSRIHSAVYRKDSGWTYVVLKGVEYVEVTCSDIFSPLKENKYGETHER